MPKLEIRRELYEIDMLELLALKTCEKADLLKTLAEAKRRLILSYHQNMKELSDMLEKVNQLVERIPETSVLEKYTIALRRVVSELTKTMAKLVIERAKQRIGFLKELNNLDLLTTLAKFSLAKEMVKL